MTTTDTKNLLDGTVVGDQVYLVSNGSRYDRLSERTFEVVKVTPTTITISLPWAIRDEDKTRTYRKYCPKYTGGLYSGRYMETGTDKEPWGRDYLVAATDPQVARRDQKARVQQAKLAAELATTKLGQNLTFENMVACEAAVRNYFLIQDEA